MSDSIKNLSDFRQDYQNSTLLEGKAAENPFEQFEIWFNELVLSDATEPNAMILATANKQGRPSARTVLLKGFSTEGFIFYTNYNSKKGKELQENPYAALLFYWNDLQRQVRIEGMTKRLSAEQSDTYFNSRPKGSRLSAVVSPQSQVVKGREFLEEKIQELNEKYTEEEEIPRPENWGGFIVQPHSWEFWQGRSNRLHDRLCYHLQVNGDWKRERLAP